MILYLYQNISLILNNYLSYLTLDKNQEILNEIYEKKQIIVKKWMIEQMKEKS